MNKAFFQKWKQMIKSNLICNLSLIWNVLGKVGVNASVEAAESPVWAFICADPTWERNADEQVRPLPQFRTLSRFLLLGSSFKPLPRYDPDPTRLESHNRAGVVMWGRLLTCAAAALCPPAGLPDAALPPSSRISTRQWRLSPSSASTFHHGECLWRMLLKVFFLLFFFKHFMKKRPGGWREEAAKHQRWRHRNGPAEEAQVQQESSSSARAATVPLCAEDTSNLHDTTVLDAYQLLPQL